MSKKQDKRPRTGKKNLNLIKKVLLINLAIFLLLLLSLEGISRLFIVKQEAQAIFNDEDLRIRGRSFIQKDEIKGFSLVPNFKNSHYEINAQGFRSKAFPLDLDSKFTILCLGESTTFGWGVDENQSYPYQLQNELNKKNSDFYVINGGVPSYTSSQVLLYMQEILSKKELKPDLILLNIMWNDIWYSSVKNWHPNILVHQKQALYLSLLIKHSYFFYALMQSFQKQEKNENIFNQEAYNHYLFNIKAMIRLALKNNVKIILIEPPFDADHISKEGLEEFKVHYTKKFLIQTAFQYNQAAKNIAKSYDVAFIQHRLGLQNIHQSSLFLDALHPKAQGNLMIAQDISQSLELRKKSKDKLAK